MSTEVMEKWLKSGRSAVINQWHLKPVEHNLLKGKPMSSQKGQAEAFFLTDDKDNWLIIKKFHKTCDLDRTYLVRVSSLLPKDPGFACGTDRQVLSKGTLARTKGSYYGKGLDQWLDGTILMPRIQGYDWATLADEIRDGSTVLDQRQRFTICKNLTRLVELLEGNLCCHRDLSCGNVFIDLETGQVYLIDFDSFYHLTLKMPQATTCGTAGYISHHAWNNGKLEPHRTWCQHADRYALALLNAEILLVKRGIQTTGDGGLFDQEELKTQSGKGIDSVLAELKAKYPHAAKLFQRAIHSSCFLDCPSPQDWSSFFNTAAGLAIMPPSINDLSDDCFARMTDILNRCRAAVPLWPAPSLGEMPVKVPQVPKIYTIQPQAVGLPPDPWAIKAIAHQIKIEQNTRLQESYSPLEIGFGSSLLTFLGRISNGHLF